MPVNAAVEAPVMTRRLTLLFAVAGGAAVANLYLAQPLLDLIASDLNASPHTAGWLVTATQIGYAAGILLVVPLGDVRERRCLLPIVMTLGAVALAACALAPSMGALLVAITLLGATTVSGQILAPLAGDLADPGNRGRVVGTVVSGLLTGILLSRTLSGLIADRVGWRAVYGCAVVLTVLLAVTLYRNIPATGRKTRLRYPSLIASVFRLVRTERIVRWTLALGLLTFATFTMFWTALTFLLSAEPYGYSVTTIGLFGLVGLAGAAAARNAGSLHDRGLSLPATGIAVVLLLVSFGIALAGRTSVAAVIAAVALLDVAVQAVMILSQTRLFQAVPDELRSRANTAFVTSNFIGGALGSAAASVLYDVGGWDAVCLTGAGITAVILGIWAVGRRSALRPVAASSST
ncbi:MFS transporter [Kineosporia sp. NBRC 101677]|uniref:MFS transporter n=1 Tax=Kineosporia sp. NBRC 101677 TaxID=3032197 RepID=UPI002553765F|nr:MFS transporter [Kineosporia sp. NBRC 101677]